MAEDWEDEDRAKTKSQSMLCPLLGGTDVIKGPNVQQLGLTAHPEGGWFRETYRAVQTIEVNGQSRSASTGIYFLLESGQVSHLHRIDADELWHHYEGHCLRIHVFDAQGYRALRLGPLGDGDAHPQHWVPAGAWFGAEVVGADGHTLVGCTVAPDLNLTP